MKQAEGKFVGVEGWGVYRLCWGGKVCLRYSGTVLLGERNHEAARLINKPYLARSPYVRLQHRIKAAGTAHPGRLAKEDAEALTIPFICLFSKEDGTPELITEYTEALEKKQENVVEKYCAMQYVFPSHSTSTRTVVRHRIIPGYRVLLSAIWSSGLLFRC